MMLKWLWVIAVVLGSMQGAIAQDLRALARIDAENSTISDSWLGGVTAELRLTRAIPFKVSVRDAPARLVLDFQEVDWAGFSPDGILDSEKITDIRFGLAEPGWSRMTLGLAEPMLPTVVEMQVDPESEEALLRLTLRTTKPETFQTESRKSAVAVTVEAALSASSKQRQIGDRPLRIMIDPGHGGLDSGAQYEGYSEKTLVLTFSKELQAALNGTGRFEALLTRQGDEFIPLPRRIALARQMQADVFMSIHADAVIEGSATGTTVYTLSERASTRAAGTLAAQLDRADLLGGVDLTHQDDEMARVLMDMAQVETRPRSELLAEMTVAGISQSVGLLRARPHLQAAFSVLRAPDIPSILIELGFMNNREDLNNLVSQTWRADVIEGIVLALDTWAVEDAAQARFLRR